MKHNIIKANRENQTLKTNYTFKHKRTLNNTKQDLPLSLLSSFSNPQQNNELYINNNCLLCQNCINQHLIQDKQKKLQREKESVNDYQYEDIIIDKLRHNKEITIANKINKREQQEKVVGDIYINLK